MTSTTLTVAPINGVALVNESTSVTSVTVNSILSNTATSSVNVTYSKNGPAENYNYLEEAYTPNTAYYVTQAVGGGAILTSDPSILLAGSGCIFNIDTSSAIPINNQYFRAHGELLIVGLTDIAQLTIKHPLIPIVTERLGMAQAELVDREIQRVLNAGTNVTYSQAGGTATARASLATTSSMDSTTLRTV